MPWLCNNSRPVPGGLDSKASACNAEDLGSIPGPDPLIGKIHWRRNWQPTPVLLPEKIPWTLEPGRLQSIGSQRVGHDWAASLHLSFQFECFYQELPNQFSSVQSFSCVWHFATQGLKVSLSITNSQSWLQTHVHQVSDDIQPYQPLASPSPPAFNLSSIKVSSNESILLHQVAKVLELQPHHQSFQWIFRVDFL